MPTKREIANIAQPGNKYEEKGLRIFFFFFLFFFEKITGNLLAKSQDFYFISNWKIIL